MQPENTFTCRAKLLWIVWNYIFILFEKKVHKMKRKREKSSNISLDIIETLINFSQLFSLLFLCSTFFFSPFFGYELMTILFQKKRKKFSVVTRGESFEFILIIYCFLSLKVFSNFRLSFLPFMAKTAIWNENFSTLFGWSFFPIICCTFF